MKDEYLLKPEPTDEEKELKATKAELAKWTNRKSNPEVVFSDTEDDVIVIPLLTSFDVENEVEKRVLEESNKYPEERVKLQDDGFGGALNDMYRQIAALSSFSSPYSEAQIATYNAMRKEYLEAFRKKARLEVIKEETQAAFRNIKLSIYNIHGRISTIDTAAVRKKVCICYGNAATNIQWMYSTQFCFIYG